MQINISIKLIVHLFHLSYEGYRDWQKITPPAFQLVLREQRVCMWLGLIYDYNQFGTIGLVVFSKNFHKHRFTNSAIYQSKTTGQAELSRNLHCPRFTHSTHSLVYWNNRNTDLELLLINSTRCDRALTITIILGRSLPSRRSCLWREESNPPTDPKISLGLLLGIWKFYLAHTHTAPSYSPPPSLHVA